MKKLLFLIALLAFGSFNSTSYAQKIKVPCPTTLNDINDCPDVMLSITMRGATSNKVIISIKPLP